MRVGAIRAAITTRRLREEVFGVRLFSDPAWDLLLDLFEQHLGGLPVPTSSACIAACVPPTTALRWIEKLCRQGLVVRRADASDARRVLLSLSPAGVSAMEQYLEAVDERGLSIA